jgi:hypothetical protein
LESLIEKKNNSKKKEWGENWKKKKQTINLDWRVRLKTNKTFIKGLKEKEIRNRKNKDKIKKKIHEKLKLNE